MTRTKVGIIIPAAGAGERLRGPHLAVEQDLPKQFLRLRRVPILVRTIAQFIDIPAIGQVIVALPLAYAHFLDRYIVRRRWRGRVQTVLGGATRQASVAAAFGQLDKDVRVVLVHDAVRPFVERALIERIIREALATGAVIPAIESPDTLKKITTHSLILETAPRAIFYAAQTPQGFHTHILRGALAQAERDHFQGTDEAGLVERMGISVHWIPGSIWNFKITRPTDLWLAEAVVRRRIATSARPPAVSQKVVRKAIR
ncbi:MAG: 2-C-methyl-D-erythritol 4-phosphate cytidylyltransferase [Acidobacteria bacterium]|nr:2-C-methyl-D-erythritol 4-phosphate cytidylyltransferase [Acidobacteriota bacterium]